MGMYGGELQRPLPLQHITRLLMELQVPALEHIRRSFDDFNPLGSRV